MFGATRETLTSHNRSEGNGVSELTPGQWKEYDYCARDLARKGLKGAEGDPLPMFLSPAVLEEINEHQEAFQDRVRLTAYGLATEF